ncbi:MAG: hypothetical protein J0I06_07570 [Planctomycetes bacterium]|nr:hypothetical protein [Planctomycetota bacterium]
MAVELRCPDCRAKLRLKVAPDPGTEVECPKCGTVFPAPEPEPEPEEEAPKEKAEKKEKAGKQTKTKKAPAAPGGPKKRKAKKRETSKTALFAVIGTGVFMLLSVAGVLIWFFSRTSKSVEMMYYVPEDANSAVGMNIGHAQKYPEFYKSVGQMHAGSDYKTAGDAVAKAAGLADMDALADYVVKAGSGSGSAIVFHTKAVFDGDALAKLSGAEKKTLDGKTYYLAPGLAGGGERQRVFAPTNRLVVVSPESTKEGTFKKMLNGHADSRDKTLGVRLGDLGKRVTRGTFWVVAIDPDAKGSGGASDAKGGAGGTPDAKADDPKAQLARTITETITGARGYGIKASLGSREVRFEIVVWYKDSEKSANVARKWKESELGKGDEGTPPKWFKEETQSMGDRKVAAQLLSNVGFGASGELFYARTAVDTIDFQQSAGNALGKVTGQKSQNAGGGTGPGAMPGAPAGGGPGAPGKTPRRRRFGPVRSCR